MIFEVKTFVRDGVAINQRVLVPEDPQPDSPLNYFNEMEKRLPRRPADESPATQVPGAGFFAQAVLNMPLGNGQMAQTQFECAIPGATVHEAFANFPAALEEGKKKAEVEMRQQVLQQQILNAGGGMPRPPRFPH